MKQIKKYNNRKLYDLETSGYVSFKDIKSFIQNGVPFQVYCHETGQDLTAKTCLAVCFEELSQRETVDLQVVFDLINKGVSK